MKKVLLFTHHLSHGGAEKIVRFIHQYINCHDFGWQSWLCVVYDDPEISASIGNLVVMKHRPKPYSGKAARGINVIKQIIELKKIKKQLGIDVCISFLAGADIINVLSGIGEKRIVSVRNEESRFVSNFIQKEYRLISYRHCDKISAVSARAKADISNYFKIDAEKVVEIPNPISKPIFDKILEEPFINSIQNKFVILNVGRLFEAKSQIQLIKAFQYFLEKGNGVYAKNGERVCGSVLVIVGDGPLRGELEAYIVNKGLENQVFLVGEKTTVSAIMNTADMFVLSSRVEGMPNVLLEALSCNLPCISTDCGAREILSPGTDPTFITDEIEFGEYGVLVPVCTDNPGDHNFELLGEAIITLAEDDELRSRYVRKTEDALKRFDSDFIGAEWIKLLNSVCCLESC